MAKEAENIGTSVRARLLLLAKATEQSFDHMLTRFAIERLLFRLGQSWASPRHHNVVAKAWRILTIVRRLFWLRRNQEK
ncbi:hypothetical protein [Insolitispirillum peregrinum]|uniref:Uncharacterized protein n=1 Tax=Insolitispirillum peregrinum TaxID=80876 RepID=A0A1N7PUX2_9PROT|nr:hypothetical protein [Insolitispirillum peregrinum]SIT14249.1 hypothetical protein SAMN05421779_10865 [Insolitispirillum peregrinum]